MLAPRRSARLGLALRCGAEWSVAITRGELRADANVELVHELLFGAVYYRLLLSGGPLDRRLVERIVDAVLPGLMATPPARRRDGSQKK